MVAFQSGKSYLLILLLSTTGLLLKTGFVAPGHLSESDLSDHLDTQLERVQELTKQKNKLDKKVESLEQKLETAET